MKFELDSNQKLIQEMVREFATNELVEKAMEIDESREFPWDSVKKMAELGLLGMITPEEYGGGGMDYLSLAIAVEEIGIALPNTCMLGAFAAVTGLIDIDSIIAGLGDYFQGSKLEMNIKCAKRGFEETTIV